MLPNIGFSVNRRTSATKLMGVLVVVVSAPKITKSREIYYLRNSLVDKIPINTKALSLDEVDL